jgi:hypothetical protein
LSGLARKPPSNRVVPPSWSSPVPNAGPWWGRRPAGCEVCREVPCCDESSALEEKLKCATALSHEGDADGKIA